MCIDDGIVEAGLSENDLILIDVAMQRVKGSRTVSAADHTNAWAAIASELKYGRRDLFSLVRAAHRAVDLRQPSLP